MRLIAPFAALALLLGLSALLWVARRDVRGARAAAFMLVAQALWVAGWTGETLASGLDAKVRWDGVTWVATVLAMGTAVWVAETQSARPRRPERLGMFALLAIMMPVAVWSAYAAWSGRPDARLVQRGAYQALAYQFTWAETALSFFLMLAVVWSAGLVIAANWRRPPRYRIGGVLLALGLAGPYLLMEVALLGGAAWLGQRDLSPLAFALFAPVTTVALLRGTSELVLIARERVVEELADAVLVVDAHGRLLDANARARTLLGGEALAIGRPLRDAPEAGALLPVLDAVETVHHVTHAGRQLDVRVSALPAGTGPDARLVLLHDVTELREANAALRTARDELEARVRERTAEVFDRERTLSAIFDNSVQYMGLLDPDGRVLACNRAALELLHLDPDQVIGRPFWETPWWGHDAEQVARLREGIRAAARGESFRMLATHPDPDGEVREVDFSLTPVRDPSAPPGDTGAVRRLVAEGRDLTELRRGERERKQLQQQVLHLQRLESIGRLAGGVAHDFNNYLTAIIGNAELVRERLADESTEAQGIDELLHAARSAADVTRQLLAIGRRQPSGVGPVDVTATLTRLHGLLRRILGEEIELRVRSDPDSGYVAIDPGPLEQVIVNLAINARDAMPAGGVVTIDAAAVVLDEAQATARALSPGAYVRLEVADTGHGMSEEVRERIFEPFFTTKAEGVGTGLGLAIVFSVLRSAGGHVEAESRPGAGTRFVMHLPRAESRQRAGEDAPRATRPRGEGRVLVVDDREDIRRLVEKVLARNGFEVRSAGDGRTALEAMSNGAHPDLLLCDVRMPGMSGPALVRAMRDRGLTIPVVYMSGQHDSTAGLEPGARLLPKPFTIDALVASVRAALEDARTTR